MNDDAVVNSEEATGDGDATGADEPTGVVSEPSDSDAIDAVESEDAAQEPKWLGTTAAAQRLGITTRTLYRFIDEGHVVAYRLGRVIRVKAQDVDGFIESCRIQPGTIGHLYPPVANRPASDDEPRNEDEFMGAE